MSLTKRAAEIIAELKLPLKHVQTLAARLLGECKYAERCNLYRQDSVFCTKWRGMYYGSFFELKPFSIYISLGARPAGCRRDLRDKEREERQRQEWNSIF